MIPVSQHLSQQGTAALNKGSYIAHFISCARCDCLHQILDAVMTLDVAIQQLRILRTKHLQVLQARICGCGNATFCSITSPKELVKAEYIASARSWQGSGSQAVS